MKSSAKKIELVSVDDLFSTEEGRQDAKLEKIQEIPLSELHPFRNHPFKVKDDEAMMETADSIKQYGVLVPAIARPDPEGGYELVAGHRRHRASELAGKETMPVIVRDLDDDAATIIMVDSNLQRESLLPSERAFAYKMKLDAMKHQGERVDLTCSQVGNKLEGKKSSEILAEQVGQSKNQIFRYIRLTELIPELLDMVDEKKIALNPAYELSFLKKEEQVDLLDAMDSEQATPSLSQAQRLKESIEAAVREHFDGMYLSHDAAKGVIETYGMERVSMVLSNTIQLQDWDGRYSRRNKEWAKTIPNDNPETVRCGYALNSHPAVLDGFIDLVRVEQQRSRTQGEKIQPSRPSVRDKLKQELPAHKPAAPKKQGPER